MSCWERPRRSSLFAVVAVAVDVVEVRGSGSGNDVDVVDGGRRRVLEGGRGWVSEQRRRSGRNGLGVCHAVRV